MAHFGDQVFGKRAVVVGIAHDGHDPVVHELARGLADQQFLFGEQRVDVEVIDAGRNEPCLSVASVVAEEFDNWCIVDAGIVLG